MNKRKRKKKTLHTATIFLLGVSGELGSQKPRLHTVYESSMAESGHIIQGICTSLFVAYTAHLDASSFSCLSSSNLETPYATFCISTFSF